MKPLTYAGKNVRRFGRNHLLPLFVPPPFRHEESLRRRRASRPTATRAPPSPPLFLDRGQYPCRSLGEFFRQPFFSLAFSLVRFLTSVLSSESAARFLADRFATLLFCSLAAHSYSLLLAPFPFMARIDLRRLYYDLNVAPPPFRSKCDRLGGSPFYRPPFS